MLDKCRPPAKTVLLHNAWRSVTFPTTAIHPTAPIMLEEQKSRFVQKNNVTPPRISPVSVPIGMDMCPLQVDAPSTLVQHDTHPCAIWSYTLFSESAADSSRAYLWSSAAPCLCCCLCRCTEPVTEVCGADIEVLCWCCNMWLSWLRSITCHTSVLKTSLQATNGGWINPEPSGNVILSRSCHQHPYDLVTANLTHSRHSNTY